MAPKRWSLLTPDRFSYSSSSTSFNPLKPMRSPAANMVGNLPEEAIIVILQYLPIPTIVNVALCSRRLNRLCNDERVWKKKLAWLDFRDGREGAVEGAGVENVNRNGKLVEVASGKGKGSAGPMTPSSSRTGPKSPISPGTNGDFGMGALEEQDDGFGDFVDVSEEPSSGFQSVSLNSEPLAPTKRPLPPAQKEDLLMEFDEEEEEDLGSMGVITNGRSAQQVQQPISPTTPSSPTTTPTKNSKQLFVSHFSALLPYYLSLQTYTTSSLLFSNPSLTPSNRAQILSSLNRLLLAPLAPTISPHTLAIVTRNLQSAADWFESAMLADFEKADERGDEVAMRNGAKVLWELNGGASVVQVYIQKRPIFYDSSHNPLKNLVKVEAPSGQMADGVEFKAMVEYMDYILSVVEKDGSTIARVFPDEADVLIHFADRIAVDVLSEYITPLLAAAQSLPNPLFLLTTAAVFAQTSRLSQGILKVEPKSPLVTKDRAEDVIYRMFEVFMDDYLQEEGEWIRQVSEGIALEWEKQVGHEMTSSDPTFLASSNPAQVKRNVLAGFTKALLLPVTIVPKTVAFGFNAITYGATGAFNTVASLGAGIGAGLTGVAGGGSSTPSGYAAHVSDPHPGGKFGDGRVFEGNFEGEEWNSQTPRTSLAADRAINSAGMIAPAAAEPSNPNSIPASATGSTTNIVATAFDNASTTASSISATESNRSSSATSISDATSPGVAKKQNFERMQLLLSLDVALQMLQSDRECLKRVQTFAGYPGMYGRKVRDTIEEVFIIILETLSEKHITPAFKKATQQMNSYKPEEHEESESVAPLIQFFELVHVGDTIQQMVQVYFDKEMASYIDKTDFLNAVVREKKRFEISLDDSVAQGLNAGVNILMNQVEHIILTQHNPRDYTPLDDADLDLHPTAACAASISCLTTHLKMLQGSTDKQILEVFYQEVGIRLHGILCKHLKRSIISLQGGFRVISDLNAYHTFIAGLKQPNVTAYFTALKMVGNIYIVDQPKELAQLVRDAARYDGTLRAEDLYEFIQRRQDFKKIEKEVDKELYGLKLQDDCVVV